MLFASEQSLIAVPGQEIHAGLQFGICFQEQEPPGRLRGQAFAKRADKSVESWSSIRRFHAAIRASEWYTQSLATSHENASGTRRFACSCGETPTTPVVVHDMCLRQLTHVK